MDSPPVRLAHPGIHRQLAVDVEVELQVVCEDDPLQRPLVAVELRAVGLQALEVGVVNILGLHVAHREAVGAGGDHVVGRAAGDACRFVGH